MKRTRRKFLKSTAALALAGVAANCQKQSTDSAENNGLNTKYQWPEVWALDDESGLSIQRIETFTGRNQTFTRVTADDGSVGWGQVANYHNDMTADVLHSMIAKGFLGRDPYKAGGITERVIEMNYKYPWSFVCRAAAGIETALWDLRGRKEEKSVAELIGGRPRPIPAYGSSMSRDIQPLDEGERLRQLRDEQGFRAFKIRVGKVNGHDEDQWPGRTEAIIPKVRQALDEDIAIFADANSCYTPPRAIEVGRQLEAHGYSMFEEPCPYWWLEWTADVARHLDMPVSGGEQDNDMAQWQRMIDMNAVDIVQPDICYIGGLSRALAVARMAGAAGKKCVPHSANLSLVTIFAAHLMTAIDNAAPFLEYSIENPPWAEGLYSPELRIEDGNVVLPDGPGWGVHPDADWLRKARVQISEIRDIDQ